MQHSSNRGRIARLAATLCLALSLSACAAIGMGKDAGGELASTGAVARIEGMNELPAPETADYSQGVRPYTIGPYDRLIIDVFGMDNLANREIAADSMGRVSFPLAGTIEAAGMTPGELAAAIRQRMRQNHVRDPQVSVNLKETRSQFVTVDGQVKMPGVYPVLPPMTLTRTIASAQGFAEFAKADDVVVLRTVNGQRYAALYNMAAIRRGNYADPAIFANDTVVVGESRQRRMFRDLLQVVPLLTTPLIVALQNSGSSSN